jgi:hypothetical protein
LQQTDRSQWVKSAARGLRLLLLLALSAALSRAAAADTSQVLVLEREIPLDHVSGRIDHMAIDLERRRLAVAELGNNSVDLIDLDSGRAVHRISGLKEPQGVAYIGASDLFAVASGGDGSVRLFRGADFSPAGIVALGQDADNIRLKGATGQIVVGYGEGALAVIDPATHSKLADIPLSAHPEGFRLSKSGNRAFVNLPDARQIVSVDLDTGKPSATWQTAGLHANFPMSIDESSRSLAIAFRDPPRLVLFDAQDGRITADVATCGDSDDVFFDDRRARIYVSCGAGFIEVFEHRGGAAQRIAQIKTYSGARTSLFVPELDRLFVAARAGLPENDAKILVFRPSP